MGQSKEPIRLRQRKTPAGLISLYLDIYLNGQRSYEYLKLYLIPETNKEDKRRNQETLKLAEAIRAKRLVELQNSEYGFKSPFKEDSNFYEYYVAMCKERFKSESMGNWGNWNSCLKHLLKYEPKLNAQMERHRQGVCLGLQELPRKRGVCVVGGQPGQSKGQTARPEQQGFLFQQAACLLQQGIRRAHHCAQSHTGNRGHQGGRGKKDVPHDRRGSAARPDGVPLSVRQTGIPVLMPDRSAP